MAGELNLREGGPADLRTTFELAERSLHATAERGGFPVKGPLTDERLERRWRNGRAFVEFLAAQPGGCYWICEHADRPVGYARVVEFGGVEELTELMVGHEHQGHGVGAMLLRRCWSDDPGQEGGRLVVATGTPSDLTLYTDFGVMPVAGSWRLRASTQEYEERRAQEIDASEPAVSVLEPAHAAAEWARLEAPALGHSRVALHEFFARDRTCLATMDAASGTARALCWAGSDGAVGPAVGEEPEDLLPVVLAALDRVAKVQEPDVLDVQCTTSSWWLVRRLRGLGFRVAWPGWLLASAPPPGLDRYMTTLPPYLL